MRRIRMILLVPVLLAGLLRADVPQFAKAIARTEGFYVTNSKAARFHNPGNLRQNGQYRHFKTNRAGWSALYLQLSKVRVGESRVYTVDMTLYQFGKKYADGHGIWAKNVAKILGVSTSSKIAEILDIPLEPVRNSNEEGIMRTTKVDVTTRFLGPQEKTMSDMKRGDIAVFNDPKDFKNGEVVIRNHVGWFTVDSDRVWQANDDISKDGNPNLLSPVRILRPGESVTLTINNRS